MSRASISTCLALAMALGAPAGAATLGPMKGQTPEQIQADTQACQAQAAQTASTQPPPASAPPPPSGGRLRGAAVGAAAGAVGAEVRGNQHEAYDRVDSDVKEEYRQNEAREAAAVGAVVGGARQRQQRRQSAQQQQAAQQQAAQQAGGDAFNACMTARGYSLSP
jgi:hypothetical protein